MNEKAKQQAELPNDGSLVLRAGADGACITVTISEGQVVSTSHC
jgi:hypothetical protein